MRIADSEILGNSLWTWELHLLQVRLYLSPTLPKSNFLVNWLNSRPLDVGDLGRACSPPADSPAPAFSERSAPRPASCGRSGFAARPTTPATSSDGAGADDVVVCRAVPEGLSGDAHGFCITECDGLFSVGFPAKSCSLWARPPVKLLFFRGHAFYEKGGPPGDPAPRCSWQGNLPVETLAAARLEDPEPSTMAFASTEEAQLPCSDWQLNMAWASGVGKRPPSRTAASALRFFRALF